MKLRGVMPPITTPFEEGEVALGRLKENLQRWNQTDLAGYLVLGSNGEAVFLNEKEKLSVVEASREVIPSSKIMLVGTGMESTQQTIHFTNQVAKIGADFALVITPSYFKRSMRPQILYDHFISVAESSKIGILIYNVPQFTGVNMEPELVARLSEHPNIIGIKDSSGNVGQLSEIVHLSHTILTDSPGQGGNGEIWYRRPKGGDGFSRLLWRKSTTSSKKTWAGSGG